MPAASTSGKAPLVHRVKQKQQSWFSKHIAEPWDRWSLVESIFVRKQPPSPPRSIHINQPLPSEWYHHKKGHVKPEHQYYTNQIVTSKYTVLTYLPRNLLEQFRRVANCFFLAIAILQFFPKFSTISPGLVILPLLVVIAITAAKDAYEDVKRHQADHRVNNSIVHTLGGGEYKNVNPMKAKSKTFSPRMAMPIKKSKKAKKREAGLANGAAQADVPPPEPRMGGVDLSRVRSQVSTWEDDPEAGDSPKELGWQRTIWEDVKEEDVAYIETKNLDGETNLKSRHGITGLSHLDSAEACAQAHLRVDLDAPEVSMFRLNGAVVNMDEEGHDGQAEIHPITLETTLLRGCVLKNTAWVIGIVIFTGNDTKIVQNSGATPSKRSKVERQMNPQVWVNLILLGTIAAVCAIVDHFNEVTWYQEQAYWELYADTSGDNPSVNGLVTFANALITFQNVIPISLYISIEFVRTVQAGFIYWDHHMKYVRNGVTTRCLARSWNLSDDLGQIQYIFSDKTGTLTQNAMIFRQCSVGGKVYTGDGETPDTVVQKKPQPASTPSDSGSSQPNDANDEVKVALPKEVLAPFHDSRLDADLEDHESEQSRILHGFFAVLGLCHTVLAAEPEPGVIEYKAQSPDEAALVQTAADVGFVFRGRDKNIVKLSTPFSDEPDEYELLHVLEFTSARKRMSVIVRKLDEEGRLFLLSKGADNVIFERLVQDSAQKELREKTDQDLQQFAGEGLRTLCLAYRVLDPNEYEQWSRDYHDATVSLNDRETQIEEVSARIEQDLVLLGATAIEDKLQDGVPKAISDLKRAGIKVWVATGDKLETAVAIGYTTHLLTPETNLIIVREGNHSVQDQLRDALDGFFGDEPLSRTSSRASRTSDPAALERINTGVRSLVGRDNGHRPGGFSLVIEGHALAHAFDSPETNDLLLDLSTRCNTVICCRVSPLQKAQIVHLIKDNLGAMCLAIGDGANDVSMIQAADVGVGISGEEGLQAVNSSDYAIAQFRYLTRLLFVHGHWSYYRNSSMILNFFYKNIINIGVLFWFMIYCGWSTTYVFAYIYLLFWNVFWTLCPVLVIGLFDRDIDDVSLMALPELYRHGREGSWFGLKRFSYYMAEGVFQSAIVFFFLNYTYATTSTRGDAWDVYIYEMSTTMAIAAVMVANLFSGLNIDAWTGWTWFGVFVGPFLIWVFTAVYSIIPPSSFYTGVYGNDVYLFRSYAFWFGWPFVTVLALMPRYLFKTFRQNIIPDDIDTMRLVRKYQPDVDPYTHPLLGGKLGDKGLTGLVPEGEDKEGNIALKDMEPKASPGAVEEGRPEMPTRASMSSARFGVHSSARGSQVDMSTGLRREASRGFGFNVEEHGVAVARMQSRLSEMSEHSRRRRLFNPMLRPVAASPAQPSSAPFGISRIRERAGSVFSPKKRERRDTVATHRLGATAATTGTDDARDGGNGGGTGSGGGTPTKSSGGGIFGRFRHGSGHAGEGEDATLGRDLGAGQNIAPPEPPRF
ncbi:hypothetical protein EHS25_001460 [Saitozyma podzolica]|uniref:Phospholipid-transporting ATPase n=1 Tax=Saitozyma podzolica TaxID=1890683 RepID=A0A427YGJ0_9TREE|nr:hypothetical protein EHS25_001460 [Saitozyma podzolica]